MLPKGATPPGDTASVFRERGKAVTDGAGRTEATPGAGEGGGTGTGTGGGTGTGTPDPHEGLLRRYVKVRDAWSETVTVADAARDEVQLVWIPYVHEVAVGYITHYRCALCGEDFTSQEQSTREHSQAHWDHATELVEADPDARALLYAGDLATFAARYPDLYAELSFGGEYNQYFTPVYGERDDGAYQYQLVSVAGGTHDETVEHPAEWAWAWVDAATGEVVEVAGE